MDKAEAGYTMDSFSMDSERKEGHFDDDFNFVWKRRGEDPDDINDAWLKGEVDEGRETEGEAEGEAAEGEEGSDPWLVEAGERARQLIEEEDDWATEAQVSRCALRTAAERTPYL